MKFSDLFTAVGSLMGRDLMLTEMANLRQRDTGIPGLIYISVRQGQHSSRVKYFPDGVLGGRSITVGLMPSPSLKGFSGMKRSEAIRLVKIITPWMKLNANTLEHFWKNGLTYDKRDMDKMYASLKKV